MDRKITKEEKRKARRSLVIKLALGGAIIIGAVCILIGLSTPSVSSKDVKIASATRVPLETSTTTMGKVVPAFEEIISSPVSATIMEVYCRPGETVEEGTPLLLLDLESEEAEINSLRDSRQKQAYAVEQQQLSNETRLTELQMQIRVKKLNVAQLNAELESERRLDSIGTGTGERVRQTELAYNTAKIELEQLTRQLENERKALAANLKSQQLDLNIASRNLGNQLRTVEDARLKAPHRGTLTYINSNIGSIVGKSEKIAVLADLTKFKINAELAESESRILTAGGKANLKVGKHLAKGTIMEISPTAANGVVNFSIIPDQEAQTLLKPGLTVNVYVVRDSRPDVLSIPLGPYYSNGPGDYEMYVETSPGVFERRKLQLGEASYDRVEIISGLNEGENVVVGGKEIKGYKFKLK